MAVMQSKDYKITKLGNNSPTILTVAEGVEEIPARSFAGMEFDRVILPSSLKRIGNRAFSACQNLKEIEIPDSVEFIGSGCFYSCQNLSKVKLSKNLKSISPDTFGYCSLYSINIPDSVGSIGVRAFLNSANSSSKLDVNLPSSVKIIGSSAFSLISNVQMYMNKDNETVFAIDASNCTYIGGRPNKIPDDKIATDSKKETYALTDDGTLIINPGIVMVSGFKFLSTKTKIKKVVFPDSVKYIMDLAFSGNPLEEYNIPRDLIYVGNNVFNTCDKNINKNILPDSTLLVGLGAFPEGSTIEIPNTCGYCDDEKYYVTYKIRNAKNPFNLMEIIDAKKDRLKAIGYDCDKVVDNFNSIVPKDIKKIKQLEDLLVTGLLTNAIDDDSVEVFTEFIKCGVSPHLYVRADNLHNDAIKFSLMDYLIINEYTKLIIQLFHYGYTVQNNEEKSKLMIYASRMKNSNLLELFLALNFPINAIDENGNTPLIIASKFGNYDCVRLLIENNAPTSNVNNEGKSALDLARKNNNAEIVTLLEYEEKLINKNEFGEAEANISEAEADIQALSKILSMEKP